MEHKPKRIVKAKIISGFVHKLFVTYDDETSEVLFRYIHEDMSFKEKEFVGLSRGEAKQLHFNRKQTVS